MLIQWKYTLVMQSLFTKTNPHNILKRGTHAWCLPWIRLSYNKSLLYRVLYLKANTCTIFKRLMANITILNKVMTNIHHLQWNKEYHTRPKILQIKTAPLSELMQKDFTTKNSCSQTDCLHSDKEFCRNTSTAHRNSGIFPEHSLECVYSYSLDW